MIRINLLPHRELKRKARQQQFAVLAGLTVILGMLIIWGVHEMVLDKIDYQNGRNQYLKDEIAVLDRQIAEIRSIREKFRKCWHAKGSSNHCKAIVPRWCTCWTRWPGEYRKGFI